MQQLLDSPALLRDTFNDPELPVESGKLRELPNILEDANLKENKVIIFSQFKTMANILYDYLKGKYGEEALRYINGDTNGQLKGIYQDDFNERDEVRIMIITEAGNYGLDLPSANYVICYDQLFNPQKMNQVLSRAHRSGVQGDVFGIHMATRGSYEEQKLKILQDKEELFAMTIEDLKSLFKRSE
ncbi:C-terminal helicase domain-containing protein [Natranaerobius trueperi]|nr:C-terminal helicase domain-containing protein [Natranaerobius trueperi]